MSKNKIVIFISHSSKNIDFVKLLTDTLVYAGIPKENIFCSSMPECDIPLGENIVDIIKKKIKTCACFICVHSKEYYTSPICLNEMGACWILSIKHYSIMLPNIRFDDMKGVIGSNDILISLNMRENELKDKMIQLVKDLHTIVKSTNCDEVLIEKAVNKFLCEYERLRQNNELPLAEICDKSILFN